MRKIAFLFLLLTGAVFAGVLDTVWRAPNLGEFMWPIPVITLADGRQFLQVTQNDTLTCISIQDGSVFWRFDVSDAKRHLLPCRFTDEIFPLAGILDFNYDGTADLWKVVPGLGDVCTLKVTGLEDSFRAQIAVIAEWVYPVVSESFSGFLALKSTYHDSFYAIVMNFDREIVYSRKLSQSPSFWGIRNAGLLGVKNNYVGFFITGLYWGPYGGGGSATVAFDINIVSGETYNRVIGREWEYENGDFNVYTVDYGEWRFLYNNYSTDFTISVAWKTGHIEHDHMYGSYSEETSGFSEYSFLESRGLPSCPISPKGKFVPNLTVVDYFFKRADSLHTSDSLLYLADKLVGTNIPFPTANAKFKYSLAQDGMIFSSEDSIYGVIFNMLFINRGWNLFANPLAEPLPLSEIFGFSCILPAYSWNNEDKIYNLTDILAPGQTAWVFSLDSGFVEIPPIPSADTLTYTLYPGWNLIGAPREGALASKITESPAVLNAVFGFDPQTNSYFVADTLQPFCGYWVFATDTVVITIP